MYVDLVSYKTVGMNYTIKFRDMFPYKGSQDGVQHGGQDGPDQTSSLVQTGMVEGLRYKMKIIESECWACEFLLDDMQTQCTKHLNGEADLPDTIQAIGLNCATCIEHFDGIHVLCREIRAIQVCTASDERYMQVQEDLRAATARCDKMQGAREGLAKSTRALVSLSEKIAQKREDDIEELSKTDQEYLKKRKIEEKNHALRIEKARNEVKNDNTLMNDAKGEVFKQLEQIQAEDNDRP